MKTNTYQKRATQALALLSSTKLWRGLIAIVAFVVLW